MNNNSRKLAYMRYKQLKTQKIGNTTITTPQPTRGRRVRQDEIYSDMCDRVGEMIEDKMIDLSRWSGEGSVFKYAQLVD